MSASAKEVRIFGEVTDNRQQPLEYVNAKHNIIIHTNINDIPFFKIPFSAKSILTATGMTNNKYSPKTLGFSKVEYTLVFKSSNISLSTQDDVEFALNTY